MERQTLLTGEEVVAALCGRWLSRIADCPDLACTGVSHTNAPVQKGDLVFFPAGRSRDRIFRHELNRRLSDLVAQGAAMIVLDWTPDPASVAEDFPLVQVKNSVKALVQLAQFCRNRFQGKTIGVTGSVGKTTVSHMLHHLLGKQAATHFTPGNMNTTELISLSCCRLPRDAEFAVFEVAANTPSRARLNANLVRPAVAVFTELCLQHLDSFDSLQTIADAKSILFEGVVPGGCAVLNHDMELFEHVLDAARAKGVSNIVTYGATEGATVWLLDHRLHSRHSEVSISVEGKTLNYEISLPGYHNVINSMAALAASAVLGLDLETVAPYLRTLKQVPGRTQQFMFPASRGGEFEVIADSFNACPASMRAGFALLDLKRPGPGGRRIAVLGDMGALGEQSATLHGELAKDIDRYAIDAVYTIGNDIRHFHDALPETMAKRHYAIDDASIVQDLAEQLVSGDIVLFKGSNESAINTLRVMPRLHAMNFPGKH